MRFEFFRLLPDKYGPSFTIYLTDMGLFFGVCPEMNAELMSVEECFWTVRTLVIAHFEVGPFFVVD